MAAFSFLFYKPQTNLKTLANVLLRKAEASFEECVYS